MRVRLWPLFLRFVVISIFISVHYVRGQTPPVSRDGPVHINGKSAKELRSILFYGPEEEKCEAVAAIASAGAAATEFMPALVETLFDTQTDVVNAAQVALSSLGSGAISRSDKLARVPFEERCFRLLITLDLTDKTKARGLRKLLLAASEEGDRGKLNHFLEDVAKPDTQLPILLAHLDSSILSPCAQLYILRKIAVLGPSAKRASPTLWRLYLDRDNSHTLRSHALHALASVGRTDSATQALLQHSLKDEFESSDIKGCILAAMSHHANLGQKSIPEITTFLSDKGDKNGYGLRDEALRALLELKLSEREVRPLLDVVSDRTERYDIRARALTVIGRIGPTAKGAKDAILELLGLSTSEELLLEMEAGKTLISITSKAEAARSLKDLSDTTRSETVKLRAARLTQRLLER